MTQTMRMSPKGTPFMMAEITSVCKGTYGQWIVTVLLDEQWFESTQYYFYTKKQATQQAKESYGLS